VTASTLTETHPLPTPVAEALSALRDARLRFFAARDGERVCLYASAGDATWTAGAHHVVDLGDGTRYEIEAERDGPVLDLIARTLRMSLTYEQEAKSAARELTERYEEINLLYFISEILASVLSLPDAATRILEEVADVLGARRASLWVYDDDDHRLHLAAAVGEDGMSGPIAVDDHESATAKVFREKQPLNLERGAVLKGVPRLEPRPQGREAFLSVPINYTPPHGRARTVGVITLVGRRTNVRFSAGDARLLTAIASQIGAALETQRLVRESLRQERTLRELELAHDLQLKLLPDPSSFEGPHDVDARCVPAESVGGDFYQLYQLPHGRLGIMIGDVSSHGFSAALIMALTLSAAGIYAQESGPPGEVLRRVHRALEKELESTEMYLTLFYGVLEPEARRLVYANAGHPHAYRIQPDGTRTRLGATDPPLGIVPLEHYGEASVAWDPESDLLCLFTDGLSDAYAGGEEALVGEIVRLREKPLRSILDRIFGATVKRQPGIPSDDRTALLVRR
jgi:sigma-B regulation protein RsbU (phosphoserine phosphatase)